MEMTTSNAVYHIATDKESDLHEWIEVIENIKEQIFVKGDEEGNKDASTPSDNTVNPPLDKDRKNLSINLMKKKFATLNKPKKSSEEHMTIHALPSFNTPAPPSPVVDDTPKVEIPLAERMKAKKASVLQEIVNTERDYVADLEIIIDVCFFPFIYIYKLIYVIIYLHYPFTLFYLHYLFTHFAFTNFYLNFKSLPFYTLSKF